MNRDRGADHPAAGDGGNIPTTAPPEELYIYYLQGRPSPRREPVSGGYLGNWQEGDTAFLFFSEPAHETVDRLVRDQPDLALLDRFRMPYHQWQGAAPAPIEAGRFTVAPAWSPPRGDDPFTLSIDPGVVFGNGTHATTRDCLELIDLAFKEEGIDTVLDLGTGTGVLAIAACRVGARQALAVDLNLLAARTAKRNIALNGLDGRALALQGTAETFIDVSADFLIANIHYDVMRRLIGSEGFLRKRGFILSGLMRSQANAIADQLSGYPVRILERRESDGVWHTVFGEVCRPGKRLH